jgi:hypothetical protein
MVEATQETLTKINLVDHAFRRLRCSKAQLCSSTSKQRTFFASDSEHLGERGAWRIDVEKSAYHHQSQSETKSSGLRAAACRVIWFLPAREALALFTQAGSDHDSNRYSARNRILLVKGLSCMAGGKNLLPPREGTVGQCTLKISDQYAEEQPFSF